MASLFEQASLAKRASDEQLVNILSNRMPSVDISQAVAMAELTSRKNMRNAAANQEMIQQGIGAVPVKDQVIAETMQSQNPQMVNPNLVAMSSPEMGNVPRSEAMDMSAPGSIPGAAAGGIVSSYKEPEGRETKGIPAAVRMFEGGRVAFQSGPGPNTVGAYADMVNRIKELDKQIMNIRTADRDKLSLVPGLMKEKRNLEGLVNTQQDPTDPFYISPDSPYMQEAEMERENAPVVEPPVVSADETPADETPEYVFTGPNATNKFLESIPEIQEDAKDREEGVPFMASKLSQESMVKPPEPPVTPPKKEEIKKEEIKKEEPKTEEPAVSEDSKMIDELRANYKKSRSDLRASSENLVNVLEAGKKDINAAVESIGKYSVEETQKLEEFRKPFNEYLAKLNKKLGRKKGDMLGNSLVKAGVALASSNDPLFVGLAKAIGIGVDTANSIQDKYDGIEDDIAKLKITQSQADEARLVGDKQRRDQAALKGAELNASVNNSIATVTSDLTKNLANLDQTQLNNGLTLINQRLKIQNDKEVALANNNFQQYKLKVETELEFAKTIYKEEEAFRRAAIGILKNAEDPLQNLIVSSLPAEQQSEYMKTRQDLTNLLKVYLTPSNKPKLSSGYKIKDIPN